MQSPAYAYQQDHEMDYSVDSGRRDSERSRRPRRPSYSRGGSRPVVVNGIHRRRHRRWSW